VGMRLEHLQCRLVNYLIPRKMDEKNLNIVFFEKQ
jgi:hypothetical protein